MTAQSDSSTFVAAFERYYPGPLVVSLLLVVAVTLITAPVLAPVDQLGIVATGFYDLLVVQLALILWWVLSVTLVVSSGVGRGLDGLVDGLADRITRSPARVVGATAVIALSLGWVNWALGLIGGVYVGQKLCRLADERGVAVHYPAVLTAGLLGLVLANQGPTSPGGLLMADSLLGTGDISGDLYPGEAATGDGEEAEQITTVEDYDGFFGFFGIEDPVAFSTFLLHPTNLVATLVLLVTIPLLLVKLQPTENVRTIEETGDLLVTGDIRTRLTEYSPPPREEWTFSDRVENSWPLAVGTGLFGMLYVVWYVWSGHSPSLLWLLFALIVLGLIVHRVPQAFIDQCTTASRWAIAIGLPFVFYAAVIVMVHEADLASSVGGTLGSAPASALPAYLLAFVVGVLVPDPGSVWLIVGPILEAATGDLVASLVVTMFAAGISNLWLGFLFLGIFASRIDGFDWREFTYYAAAISVYASAVVVGVALLV